MSAKSRFLNSVSGIALTAALATLSYPAYAEVDSASGSLPAISPLNQGTVGESRITVEAESSDTQNEVQVLGTVQSNTIANHLNAIGVHITGWDIEASGARDSDSGPAADALAENNAIVNGVIVGTVINPDFAPGTSSYGVLVADDIQAEDAWASATDFGDFGDDFDPAYNVSVTATARNIIAANGSVAGGSTDSFGVRVDGEVHATFALATIDVDNFFGPVNQALAVGRALNIVAISGAVGGETASPGSVGFYVAGDVYANYAEVDGNSFFFIPELGMGGLLADVYTTGIGALDILASNTVQIEGAVTLSGGTGAIGVFVGGNVFAEGALAAGSVRSDGGQLEVSLAAGLAVAENRVAIGGAAGTTPATGVQIVGDVYAVDATAFGEGIARFGDFYEQAGGASTTGEFTAIAANSVSIFGSASGAGGIGVDIGGDVFASFAEAGAFAGANPYNFIEANETNVSALAIAIAANSVVITGVADGNGATGVAIGEGVFASYSDSQARGTSYGEFTLDDEDPAPAVLAQTTVVSTAGNAVSIVGTVGDSVTDGTGVDPVFVSANNASAYGSAYAQAVSNGGAGATATASNSVAASNAVGLTASLGDGATTSTGIIIDTFVESNNAEADGYSTAYAYSNNADTISTAGATATAANDVEASNAVGVVAILGETVSGSTGIYIGTHVDAVFATAFGNSYASANVSAGGAADAVAGADQTIDASNSALVNASIGAGASESTGISIGVGGVTAAFASARGFAEAYAYNSSLGGDATATADQLVSASNGAGVSVTLGQGSVTSTGATIGNDVDAFEVFAEGFASAYAQSQPGDPTGTGSAIATVNNSVSALNSAGAVAAIGLSSDSVIGIQIEGNLEALYAEAVGFAEGYASVNAGTGNATALVTNTVAAGNEAVAVGVLADGNTLSAGVWIGEGIAAIGAFAEGTAEAEADANSTTGYALATANNTVTASNIAGAIGSVGNGSTGSTGVYVGAGIIAMAAEAEGEANAGELFDVGSGAYSQGSSVGNATAAAIGSVAASNSVTIGGTVGANGQGATGVFVEAPGLYDLPFIGTVPVGAAAVNAFAEGLSTAAAWAYGGTGNAQATASNNVFATNTVAINGVVGGDNTGGLGVGIDEGAVFAAFAEASGAAIARAERGDGTGDAIAGAGGTIGAGNVVSVLGTVGDASYDTDGVVIGQGPVGAGLAAADGFFYASSDRSGVDAGNATASIGAEGALAAVYAGNAVAVGGTVSGINGISGGTQGNNGVRIGEDVGAVGALADGEFRAQAGRGSTGSGNATASVWGDVAASNLVFIDGLVTAGSSDLINDFVGDSSNGAYIDGSVVALGSAALGYGRAEALGTDGATGNAVATTTLATRAINGIDIAGAVESYNNNSVGVYIGEGVGAALAFAEGSGSAYADSGATTTGLASATAENGVLAANSVSISGAVGVTNSYATGSLGVWIAEGVTATLAFAEGSADSTAIRDTAGAGNATARAVNDSQATNYINISGIVGESINNDSTGVVIGEGVSASVAFAEGNAFASAERTGGGAGIATATALDSVLANNVVAMVGEVGSNSWYAYGIDPAFVNASDATAISSAFASANGPAGSTAIATATANAHNVIDVDGTVGTLHNGSTGVWIGGDVTALNALASASTDVRTNGSATGTGTATANALNQVDLNGSVASNGDGSTGIYIGGNVITGGLGVTLSSYTDAGAGTAITSTGTGTMYNVVNIAGDVGSGDNATNSTGVYIGGNVEFGGDINTVLSFSLNGDGASTALQVIEGANVSTITGAVGTASSGSHGVWIGGNVEVTNNLVSSFIIEGSDATNDGTTRGVYIGGSVLTGDALDSQVGAQAGGRNTAEPAIPDPLQIGDYVELAGSVFIGANGGTISHGVAVGGGNDTVLVRDTHFQMEVVNGFDGGSNPDGDGQDVISFDYAQIFVSNIDNFELMNVRNHSAVILTNPSGYIYTVRDEVNISDHSILMFGDGGAPPPFPIASGAPVNAAELTTEMLTIGGIQGVPTGGFDDSILKAENNGTGSYIVNADVYNFGTITLSKVLSTTRGTDPHGLLVNGPTSFDEDVEQQFWAVTGSWNIDPTSGPGDFLQINGNYTAASDIILDTFVFKSTSPSDVVEINGNVAGVTTVWINNTNTTGTGAFTGNGPNDGILVVDVNNVQDPNDVGQAFVLGNTSGWNWADPGNFPEPEMQVGAFVYTLNQGGPDDRNFYLRSQLLDQVPAYTVMTSAIQQHFYAELGTLYQRMGELRHADLGTKANTSFFEFWMRGYGQDVNMDPKEGFEFDMTSKGFMIGGDYAVRNWLGAQSRLHLGGFGGYGWTKLDDIKGSGAVGNSDGKTDGYTLGLYATYFDTAKKHQGLYADAVLKFNFLDSEYSSSTRDTKAKSDDFAWGASLELGYGIGLGNGFIIQPQGQLSYMQVSKEKFKESSPGIPLEVERDKGESLRGRLGLQLQNTWVTSGGTQFSPYVIGNVLHEFMGDNTTTVAGTPFHNDMGGTWYNAGAGFTVDFDNVGLYGHVEYNFGERIEGLAGGIGVKIKLGGSSPVAAAAPPPAPPVAPKKNFIVFFDFDRSNITADAQRVIDEAATAAKAGNSARVQLTGHTDRSGSEQYNMALSLRRGEAVKQAMIARGIPANSIVIIGRGESQPLVPTADGVREPQNRRVEIIL